MSLDVDLSSLTSSEIDNMITEKEKELRDATIAMGVIEEANHRLAKQILELRIKKKDCDIALDKARYNVKLLTSEVKILTSAFWQTKHSGR